MNINYVKHHSQALGRDMKYKTYGQMGHPVLVFPSQDGHFYDYHDPLVYDNSPFDFLSHMPSDHPYWNLYRQRRIVMCVGQGAWEDELLDSTRQIVYFMGHLLTDETVEYMI